jgi:copper homeostasis protein (lipoprotein)
MNAPFAPRVGPASAAFLAGALFLFGGCAPGADTPTPPAGDPAPPAGAVGFTVPDAPRAWRGVLPCADCAGIHTTLELRPDGTFRIDAAYLGLAPERIAEGDTLFGSRGRWTLDGDPGRIRLDGGLDGPRFFRGAEGGALRALDRSGAEIETEQNLALDPLSSLPSLGGGLREDGLFRYVADAATFAPCSGGIQTPVAMEGAYRELEAAYGGAAPEPGALVRVFLEGRVEARPAMEGEGTEDAFVVETFTLPGSADGDRPCALGELHRALEERAWRLVALEGEPVQGAGPEAPTLLWRPEVWGTGSVTGSGGCNRFTGRAALRGAMLFVAGPIASTRVYCEGAMELENRYFVVLDAGGYLRLEGDTLRLFRGPVEAARFVPAPGAG